MTKKTRPKFARPVDCSDSTSLRTIHYDPDSRVLDVAFSSGERYRYEEVTHEKFARLVVAESRGSYFASAIRKTHEYRRLPRRKS